METITVVDKLLARGQEDGYFAIGGHGMLNFLQRYENIYKVQKIQGIVDDFICIFLKIGLCSLWTTDQTDHWTNPYNKTHTRTCGCVFFKSRWSIGQFWSMRQ